MWRGTIALKLWIAKKPLTSLPCTWRGPHFERWSSCHRQVPLCSNWLSLLLPLLLLLLLLLLLKCLIRNNQWPKPPLIGWYADIEPGSNSDISLSLSFLSSSRVLPTGSSQTKATSITNSPHRDSHQKVLLISKRWKKTVLEEKMNLTRLTVFTWF